MIRPQILPLTILKHYNTAVIYTQQTNLPNFKLFYANFGKSKIVEELDRS